MLASISAAVAPSFCARAGGAAACCALRQPATSAASARTTVTFLNNRAPGKRRHLTGSCRGLVAATAPGRPEAVETLRDVRYTSAVRSTAENAECARPDT